MLFGLFEKIAIARSARFFHSRPNSTARRCDLLIRFAACAALEIVQSSSSKYQMRVRIDKSRKDNPSTSINNLRVTRVLLDLITGSDDIDPAIMNEHSAVGNDSEFRHLSANARSFRTRQCDELRSVKNGERAHGFKTARRDSKQKATKKTKALLSTVANNKTSFASFPSVKVVQPSLASTI